MTITLEVPPEMEAQLCERAAKRGQTVTDYMMTLAESEDYFSIYEWESEADHQEAIAVIEQELEDLHAGGDKGMLLEDYRAEVMAEYHAQAVSQSTGAKERVVAA